MSRTLSRGNKWPGPTFSKAGPGLLYLRPVVRPPSRVSVRRSSCCLISACSDLVAVHFVATAGPSSSSKSLVVGVALAILPKNNGNGSQRPRTRKGRGRNPMGSARPMRRLPPCSPRPSTSMQARARRPCWPRPVSCPPRPAPCACLAACGFPSAHAFSPRGPPPGP
mgnify:CR=1 FL=1